MQEQAGGNFHCDDVERFTLRRNLLTPLGEKRSAGGTPPTHAHINVEPKDLRRARMRIDFALE